MIKIEGMARWSPFFALYKQFDIKLEGVAFYIFECLTLARAFIFTNPIYRNSKFFFFLSKYVRHFKILPWLECPAPPPILACFGN